MRENERFSAANPFRVPPEVVPSPRKLAFYSALKVCLVAVVALAVTSVLATQSQRWLFYRLTQDFDSLSPAAQSLRLVEIAGLDARGIPFLVENLAAQDSGVARQAYDLLRDGQRNWTLLGDEACRARHESLVSVLPTITDRLAENRTGWVTSLLQQTIVEHVQQETAESRELHLRATDLLASLSISDRPDIRIASATSEQNQSSVVRPQPLAVDTSIDNESWTQWPPPPSPSESVQDDMEASDPSPSIYRSGTKNDNAIKLIPEDPEAVSLKTFVLPTRSVDPNVEIVAHEMQAPLETYNIRSVIYWLASTDSKLRRHAELELLRRGLDETQIALAKSLSMGNIRDRLETIERIVHDDSVDPRPWLLWLLDDENREVKLRVVNILATIPDPAIGDTLRERISTESDPTVAARIRSVLDLR